MMVNNRTIWFDLETTGLNPFHDKIIEIGARDNKGAVFHALIKINNSLNIEITKLTGITDEILETQGRSHNEVIIDFYKYITLDTTTNHRVFMIAHNGDDFDKIFLKTQLKKLDLQIPSNVYFIDSIFVSKLLYPRIINHHSLLSLGRYFSVIDENAHIHHTPLHPYTLTPLHQYTYTPIHRSLGDVKTLYKLWNIWMSEFYKQYGKNDIITVYNTIYF